MGVDTTMFAGFEGLLAPPSIKRFKSWHDETFEDSGYYSTPTAWHLPRLKLTVLRIDWEYIDPDVSQRFEQEMGALAKKAKCQVTVIFDCDGDFDPSGLVALLGRSNALEDELFGERLEPIGDEWIELELDTGKAPEPEPEEPEAPAQPVLPWCEPSALVGALRALPASQLTVTVGDLVFTRSPSGRMGQLLITKSAARRDLRPLLKALKGFVTEVTVESPDDIVDARDLLDLSVRVKGVKNPFLDP